MRPPTGARYQTITRIADHATGVAVIAVIALGLSATRAGAAPPEPAGPHPRILLDAQLRAAWRASANKGPVKAAILLCDEAHRTPDYDQEQYQGSIWAKVLQACLVAWAVTDQPRHAQTAIRFFDALLDDRDRIGDRLGGDESARRDSGYAIRNLGPYTALAYDWLHDKLTVKQRAKARQRWAAWLAWYEEHGYRARSPGSNYHAGYLVSATMIAIAQAGEADKAGTRLWAHVADQLWGKDMAAALATGGILDGGDWPEGWQYGPLAVTSYALAARVARRAGIVVEVEAWLASLLRRHVYGLTPGGRVWAGGDTEEESAFSSPKLNTLNAISIGDAAPEIKRWAKGESARMQLADNDTLLHHALGAVGEQPSVIPRASWPTWYLAAATGTLFARTRWDDRAVWFVAECAPSLETDHRHPNAGNFALTRGPDDVIVDPTPYGSLSTLTSNAPTVVSAHLPANYIPSQAYWGKDSGWDWATQTVSGVVAARCDYADQYRFQHRPSDVPEALRDLVLLPNRDGTDASLVVIDRAITGATNREMYLRFRVPVAIALDGEVGTGTIGRTRFVIEGVSHTDGKPEIGRPTEKTCFTETTTQGRCDAARFPVTEYRIVIPGPKPRAVHVISAVASGVTTKATKLGDETWSGVQVSGPRDAVVVWPHQSTGPFVYRAPRGKAVTHVILDGPELGSEPTIVAKADGSECAVNVLTAGSKQPSIVTLDDTCRVTLDPRSTNAPSPTTKPRSRSQFRRAGCCSAQGPAESTMMLAVVVLVLLRRRFSRRG